MFDKRYKTGFQSEIDAFFHDFDKKRKGFPPARLEEIKKHQAIALKRDHAIEDQPSKLWEGF